MKELQQKSDFLLFLQNYSDYRLCFINGHYNFFFSKNFRKQTGEDWHLSPWRYNAELPNGTGTDDIINISFLPITCSLMIAPDTYSVNEINKKIHPWFEVMYSVGNKNFEGIFAGMSFTNIVNTLHEYGIFQYPENIINDFAEYKLRYFLNKNTMVEN